MARKKKIASDPTKPLKKGDPTKPVKISDKEEFEYRNQMYNDSLDAYNESLSTIKSFGVPMGAMGNSITEPYDIPKASSHNPHTNDLIFNVPALGNMVVHTDDSARYKGQPYIKNHNIEPSVYLEGRGGTMGIDLFTKPKQPVEYQPRPSYQQIPTKQPNLQSSLITDEQLTPAYVKNAIEYPKDVQRFTAGNYLESQGMSSGYVNYGNNEGRVEMKKYGGPTDPKNPELYNSQRAKELGYKPDETGHMPSVDAETGMWLKSKEHPTAFKELMAYTLNLGLNRQLNPPVINPDGYFGENQLQYTEKTKFKTGGQMSNRRKLSKDEILRNIAAGKYVLGGETGVTPDIPQTIDLGAPSMFAQDITGTPISQNTAPNLEPTAAPGTTPSKYNSTMGTAVAAATSAARLATSLASPYVEQKSIPKNTSVEAGTDMLGGIPIVGQFYGLGSAVGDGIAIGEDSLRAQGKDSGAEAVAGVRGAIDPASGWSQNAALYDQGIITKGEATERMIAQFFLPGIANAASSRSYDEHLANSWKPPQSATFSAGDGTFDGAGGRPVVNEQLYGKYGGQMNQYGKSNLTHYNGLDHPMGGIPLKDGVEVKGGETGHRGFVFTDDIYDPSTKQTYARMSKKEERRHKDKSDPRVTKDLDLVLEHLKGKQEAHKKLIGIPEAMEKAKFGGKYFGGGLIEPVGYTAAEVAAMGDADPFRVEWNSPVPPADWFTPATMNGNYDNPDIRPAKPKYKDEPNDAETPYVPIMDNYVISQEDADKAYNYSLDKNAAWNPPTSGNNANSGVGQNWGQLGLLGANIVASNIGNILGLGKLKDGYDHVTPETIQPQKQDITQLLENIKSGVATARYNNRQSGRAGVGEDRSLLSAGLDSRAAAISGLENQYMASKLQSDQFNAQSKMQAKDLTAQNKGAFDTREQQIYDSLGQNISGAFGDYGQYTQNQDMRGILDTYFEDYDYTRGKNGKYSFVRKGKKA